MLSPCQSFGLDYSLENTQVRSLHRLNSTASGYPLLTMQYAEPWIGIPVCHSCYPCSPFPERACCQESAVSFPPPPHQHRVNRLHGFATCRRWVGLYAWVEAPFFSSVLSQCRHRVAFALFLGLCMPAEGARESSSSWLPDPSERVLLENLWST